MTGVVMTDLAREWHALSDHAADGTPFGGGLCNCVKQAQRVEAIVTRHVNEALEAAADDVEAGVLPTHPNSGYRDGFHRAASIVRARIT